VVDLLDFLGECGPSLFICFDKKMWLLSLGICLLYHHCTTSIISLKHSDATWLTIITSVVTAFANEGAKRITQGSAKVVDMVSVYEENGRR